MTVTAASVQDRDGAHPVLALLREKFSTIRLVGADGGYAGRLHAWARKVLGQAVTIVKRSETYAASRCCPAGGWWRCAPAARLVRYRRLERIYERKPEHHEALIWWATVHQMTRRLTRELAGRPLSSRWTDPAAATGLVQPEPARQGLAAPGRSAPVASLERKRPDHSTAPFRRTFGYYVVSGYFFARFILVRHRVMSVIAAKVSA
ncbi:transposase [Nonomuraea rubra]